MGTHSKVVAVGVVSHLAKVTTGWRICVTGVLGTAAQRGLLVGLGRLGHLPRAIRPGSDIRGEAQGQRGPVCQQQEWQQKQRGHHARHGKWLAASRPKKPSLIGRRVPCLVVLQRDWVARWAGDTLYAVHPGQKNIHDIHHFLVGCFCGSGVGLVGYKADVRSSSLTPWHPSRPSVDTAV